MAYTTSAATVAVMSAGSSPTTDRTAAVVVKRVSSLNPRGVEMEMQLTEAIVRRTVAPFPSTVKNVLVCERTGVIRVPSFSRAGPLPQLSD